MVGSRKRYSLQRNAIRVGNGGLWIVKNRVVGIFTMSIKRVTLLMQKHKAAGTLIDVTGRSSGKSLILLDDGTAVLSPFTANTIAHNFDPEAKEGDE